MSSQAQLNFQFKLLSKSLKKLYAIIDKIKKWVQTEYGLGIPDDCYVSSKSELDLLEKMDSMNNKSTQLKIDLLRKCVKNHEIYVNNIKKWVKLFFEIEVPSECFDVKIADNDNESQSESTNVEKDQEKVIQVKEETSIDSHQLVLVDDKLVSKSEDQDQDQEEEEEEMQVEDSDKNEDDVNNISSDAEEFDDEDSANYNAELNDNIMDRLGGSTMVKELIQKQKRQARRPNPTRAYLRANSRNSLSSRYCKLCTEIFDTTELYIEHQNSVHVEHKKYPCSFCSKRFGTQSNRKEHERIHTGTTPYVCVINDCKRGFTQISNLKKHMKIHGDDNDLCCSSCLRQFTTYPTLEKHLHKCLN